MEDDGDLQARLRRASALADPVRMALYRYLCDRTPAEVGRDEAAGAVGIRRKLAAFHLDRLVAAGVLSSSYRRLNGRAGPGAGRPSKVYRPSGVDVGVAVPARRYDLAARIFADALGLAGGAPISRPLRNAARRLGRRSGESARARSAGLMQALAGQGFEPVVSDGAIRLRGCAFGALKDEYGRTLCEAHLAYQQGLVEGFGAEAGRAVQVFGQGFCCVAFEGF